jgi:amidase
MSHFAEYDQYDALGLADLVRRGEVSALGVLEAAISRADQLNPALNAIITRFDDVARHSLRHLDPESPFYGVPFLLKDLLAAYAGQPFSSGSRFGLQHIVASVDSTLVTRHKAAGLVIFGKTATPEFGLSPYTEPAATGITRNPWDPMRTPGGSSGGTAAAVAAGIVPMASAGDGGGSIRSPASSCGVFGLKPSRGRNPVGPDIGDHWFGFAQEHAITRTVRDSAALLDATHGALPGATFAAPPPARSFLEETRLPAGTLKIGFSVEPIISRALHADCRAAVENTAKRLRDLGHEVEPFEPRINSDDFIFHYARLLAADTAMSIRELEHMAGRRAAYGDFELRTRALEQIGRALTGEEIVASLWFMQDLARRYATDIGRYDVFLSATLGEPPIRIGALAPTPGQKLLLQVSNLLPMGKIAKRREFLLGIGREIFDYTAYTMPANVAGLPSMSVPLDWNAEGLPIGTLITGRFGDEATLFRLAAQLEQAHPWADKKPKLPA